MSSFWGVEVKPGKPYTLSHSDSLGRLRLTQATLGDEVGKGDKGASGKKCVLQCHVEEKNPVYLCVLVPEKSETCHLELEFEEESVTFSVIGLRSIHLAGYYILDDNENDMSDSDAGGDSLEGSDDDGLLDSDDMLGHMETGSEDDSSNYDSESDDDVMYNQRRGKSSVVIEEIQEDDKPVVGEVQKGSNKKTICEKEDKSQLQLAVRTPPAESIESEDEDGFPVSFGESKKGCESVSKNAKETSNEDRKRKSEAMSNRRDSSGEVKAENDGASKKKKKAKDKSTEVVDKEKEVKQQDSPSDPVGAKQKKKKNNASSSEVVGDQQSAKKTQIHKDANEVTPQEANKKIKKNKKQKTQEANKSEKQAQTGIADSGSKEPFQTRTFGNGMIIQELEMGKPDGKRATRGKKVSVRYIGKLKNGKIFDSNVSGRPFEFRLGVGEVIKGWDIGVDGMRIGDKRRLTVPPSMGYGDKKVGPIPQNSTLYFDVELVNVR